MSAAGKETIQLSSFSTLQFIIFVSKDLSEYFFSEVCVLYLYLAGDVNLKLFLLAIFGIHGFPIQLSRILNLAHFDEAIQWWVL